MEEKRVCDKMRLKAYFDGGQSKKSAACPKRHPCSQCFYRRI